MATDKITIKAKSEHGRWRAGRHFTRAGVDLAVADLTAADLDALRRDPELVITGGIDAAAEAAAQAEAAQAAAEAAAPAEAAKAAGKSGKKAGK